MFIVFLIFIITMAGSPSAILANGKSASGNLRKKPMELTDVVFSQYNKSETKYFFPNLISEGSLKSAPIFKGQVYNNIDIIAHWYNDFGLMSTALWKNKRNGGYTWYDWSWNYTTNNSYDPSRHPLIGWYRGDDINVLDWTCYWLLEYGIGTVSLVGDFDTKNWMNPNNKNYWKFLLFNKTPNFRQIKYIAWFKDTGNKKEIIEQHEDLLSLINEHSNVYTYKVGSKLFPAFYVWEFGRLERAIDSSKSNEALIQYLRKLASRLKNKGYDGICLLARHLNRSEFNDQRLASLATEGIIILSADYSTRYADDAAYNYSYKEYATKVQFPRDQYTVSNILTSAKTMKPHPSKFNLDGSTPELFSQLLSRALFHVSNSNVPKVITVNNVSEWAESGPGLFPNMRDRFGYLKAVKSSVLDARY